MEIVPCLQWFTKFVKPSKINKSPIIKSCCFHCTISNRKHIFFPETSYYSFIVLWVALGKLKSKQKNAASCFSSWPNFSGPFRLINLTKN